jgi:hypothetical protein
MEQPADIRRKGAAVPTRSADTAAPREPVFLNTVNFMNFMPATPPGAAFDRPGGQPYRRCSLLPGIRA